MGYNHFRTRILTDTGKSGLELSTEADDLNFGTLGGNTTLDTASRDGTTSGDREDICSLWLGKCSRRAKPLETYLQPA